MGTASLDRFARLPNYSPQIGGGQRIETGQIARPPLRTPRSFQEHVVQAKGEIEGRVAVASAFGIQEDRSARAAQQVLRTHVAVHEGALGSEGSGGQIVQSVRE